MHSHGSHEAFAGLKLAQGPTRNRVGFREREEEGGFPRQKTDFYFVQPVGNSFAGCFQLGFFAGPEIEERPGLLARGQSRKGGGFPDRKETAH